MQDRFGGLRGDDAKKLDQINFSFAHVADGRASVAHWENAGRIKSFIRENRNIKSVLSIGGWGAGGFSPAVSSGENRKVFSESISEIVNDFYFEGVDLDWEYPCDGSAGIEFSPDDKTNFTLLVEELRERLGAQKLLTMAAGAGIHCANNLELPRLAELMDHIIIMTYDMASSEYASHHTSLYRSEINPSLCADQAIREYNEAGVPFNKLVIGAAFYARVYAGVDGIGSPFGGGFPPGLGGGYKNILARAEAAGGIKYDEQAEAPYIYDEAAREFITFDDERSIRAKRAYAEKMRLAGIMFWEYSNDAPGSPLLNAMV